VVVSRWFGGVLLHNDRFKHINNACRMILVKHDYIKKVTKQKISLINDWKYLFRLGIQ
jgi:hypothetical protein